ncbi:FHA domain-containing protein [Marinitoga aeolica]|uniref:FHA domain-containing protein n=1 Tax=Marinitoga aeolica TaxID=2809031 RepID=A0ABY8PRD9_9BACT|nr:FHA domain-containing protein [Marinitoga aeolica]WGS65188.1 FHA domain-containing protein [Marinitoga aeolica]
MKKCLNCQREYEDDYPEEFCECGGYIIQEQQTEKKIEKEMNEFLKVLNVVHENNQLDETIGDYEINKNLDDAEIEKTEKIENIAETAGIIIKVYSSKKELIEKNFLYDEILIGRKNPETDIDLEDFDLEKEISKRHIKIIRENNEYYLLRLTKKTPIYLNQNIVKIGEKIKLNDADKIIISKKIGIQVSFM